MGLSALLVSTNRAMREPLHCGTGDRAGSTFLCVWAIHENKHCQQGSRLTAKNGLAEMIGLIQSHFTDIETHIVSYISSANGYIKVAVAWFTNQVLFDCLVEALERSVEVKVLILDDILNRCEFGLDFGVLVRNGADVRFANSNQGTMHNKFCIVDDKVITGSYNWTYQANKNDENVIVTDEKSIVENYAKEFNRLFSDGISVEMPYEYLSWTDIKEGDFSELRRNIYKDVITKNDVDKELKKNKLISLDNAYKSGRKEEISAASSLPVAQKVTTITDVLTSRWHDYELKLWEENKGGKPRCDVWGYVRFVKWIFLPLEYHAEYIRGTLKVYGDHKDLFSGNLYLNIFDREFISSVRRYVKNENLSYRSYEKIPEDMLCIQNAKMSFYKFPTPMHNTSQPPTWGNRIPRLIPAINVFCIAETVGKETIYYPNWNPEIRGKKILERLFG